jgi:hypothetical protein
LHDPFSGRFTVIRGAKLPGKDDQAHLIHHYERGLEAIARLGAAAAQCSLTTDSERDLLLLPEDTLAILETEGGQWANLFRVLCEVRGFLPLLTLEKFGFPTDADDPLDEKNPRLRRIGTGMEVWAFADEDGSIYKFFMPRDVQLIGAGFRYDLEEDSRVMATAVAGSYHELLAKLALLNQIGGMPTEIVGLTVEGILVVKQTRGIDTSSLLPAHFLECPSRILNCDRKHPRLVLVGECPWLVADLHEKNFVYDAENKVCIIDLVAAPISAELINCLPLMKHWIQHAQAGRSSFTMNKEDDRDL